MLDCNTAHEWRLDQKGKSMMNLIPAKRICWLAAGLAVFFLGVSPGFTQEPKKGKFIDGEFIEDYVYVPDFMSPEELKGHIDRKSDKVVAVDTAARVIFEEEHISGAISFPWVENISLPVGLPRDKTLVLYCACNDHEDSVSMAEKLSHLGYLDVKVLKGGWFTWVDLRYDIVSKEPVAAPVSSDELVSGLKIGTPTQAIPVLDITGPYKGEPICYVCEFQDDPNVLAFFRDKGEETAKMIVQLNDLYLKNKASGFKAVAMIMAGEEAKTWLEDLNRSAKIEIPLTVFRKGPRDVAARLYELNPKAENTFLVTINRLVAANVSRIRPDEFDKVARAAAEVLAQKKQ